jgi:hypothetical protein
VPDWHSAGRPTSASTLGVGRTSPTPPNHGGRQLDWRSCFFESLRQPPFTNLFRPIADALQDFPLVFEVFLNKNTLMHASLVADVTIAASTATPSHRISV